MSMIDSLNNVLHVDILHFYECKCTLQVMFVNIVFVIVIHFISNLALLHLFWWLIFYVNWKSHLLDMRHFIQKQFIIRNTCYNNVSVNLRFSYFVLNVFDQN